MKPKIKLHQVTTITRKLTWSASTAIARKLTWSASTAIARKLTWSARSLQGYLRIHLYLNHNGLTVNLSVMNKYQKKPYNIGINEYNAYVIIQILMKND